MAARKRKTKKRVRRKSTTTKPNALTFCRDYLKKKPKAPFAEIRDAAKKKRIILYPISYGRAQALEGLIKMKPYGSKKKSAANRGPGRPKGSKNKKRGPGRPKVSKNRRSETFSDLGGLVRSLQDLQRDRDRALSIIEKIRSLVE